MTTVKTTGEPSVQSAAAPSPFPPIAEYAFLSDCHTGALVAPAEQSAAAPPPVAGYAF